MNIFSHLYCQFYQVLKKLSKTQVSRFRVFAALIALQFLNVVSLFPTLGQPFRPEANKVDVFGMIMLSVIGIVIPMLNYTLIDFDQAEKRAGDDNSKVSWKFLLYVIASFILFALRPTFFIDN